MAVIVKNEVYKYKDREFNIKLLETVIGFFVFIFDARTKKRIKSMYRVEHKVIPEIIKKGLCDNPVEDIVMVAKKDLNLCVDKNLI